MIIEINSLYDPDEISQCDTMFCQIAAFTPRRWQKITSMNRSIATITFYLLSLYPRFRNFVPAISPPFSIYHIKNNPYLFKTFIPSILFSRRFTVSWFPSSSTREVAPCAAAVTRACVWLSRPARLPCQPGSRANSSRRRSSCSRHHWWRERRWPVGFWRWDPWEPSSLGKAKWRVTYEGLIDINMIIKGIWYSCNGLRFNIFLSMVFVNGCSEHNFGHLSDSKT